MLSLPLLPSQPTTSPLLFFFTTPTLILPPSACPLSSAALLLSCPPHPPPLLSARRFPLSLFPPLSLSCSQLWIWRMHRAEAGLALKKRRAWTANFLSLFFFFFFPSYLELPSGVPYVRFLPAAETKPPMPWAEALLGALELFENTYNSLTGMSLPLVTRVRLAHHIA